MEVKNRFVLYFVALFAISILLFMVRGEVNSSLENEFVLNEIGSVEGNNEIFILEENNSENNLDVLGEYVNSSFESEEVINEANNNFNDSISLNNFSEKDIAGSSSFQIEKLSQDCNETECNNLVEINDNNQSEVNRSLRVVLISSPIGNLSNSSAFFSFYVNISNIDNYECHFGLYNITTYNYTGSFNNSSNISINRVLDDGNYSWNMDCFDSNSSLINDSISGSFSINIDKSPKIIFYADKINLTYGETTNIRVNATLYSSSTFIVSINYSDGRLNTEENVLSPNNYYSKVFTTQFLSQGYNRLGLTLNINGIKYYSNLILYVSANSSNITNNSNVISINKDNQKPEVDLILPEDNADVNSSSLDFVFHVKDNVKISNCTFSLYYYNTSQFIGSVVYQQNFVNPENDKNITLTLREFDEGDYSWDVECRDNSSNLNFDERDFYFGDESILSVQQRAVSLSNKSSDYGDDVLEVERLISMINEFLVNEERYDKESKEAVEFLGLLESSRFYKKRLIQLKSDLNDNLGYSRDSSEKEKRLNEIRNEIKDIKAKAVYDLNVEKSETYSKNSLNSELSEIIGAYLESNNVFMSDKEVKRLVERVSDMQNNLSVETHIKWISFEYLDESSEDYSLVYKKLNGEDQFEGIIEVIPKSVASDVSELDFIQEFSIIKKDPIVFFDSEVITDNIAYLVKSKIDFEELRKIDSIGFSLSSEESYKKNSITGYSVLLFPEDKGFWFYFSWILFLAFITLMVFNSIRVSAVRKIKRDPNYEKIRIALKKAKDSLEDKNLSKAKESYLELKELYSYSNEEIKRHFYKELIKVQTLIDRREISSLIRECIQAINDKRNSDATLIYSKIKPIYKRLPEDLRSRVYEKIIPFVK